MSDNTDFDPFDKAAQDVVQDAAQAADTSGDFDSVDMSGDEFDDLLDGADFDLEEDESEGDVKVRDAGEFYSNPIDVGLKDKMWVPVRILTSEVKEEHVPRLSSKVCIAVKTGADGKKRAYFLYDQVEAELRNGATEVIKEHPLPYFVCTANHVAPRFGQRRYDYEIEVPVFTVKTALFKAQKNRTGYENENGRSLRKATGATAAGERVSKTTMHEVAGRMQETVIMAQVSISTSKNPKFRDRLDDAGNTISVLLNEETGDAVTVFKPEGAEEFVIDGSGEVWNGDERLLVPVDDRRYAIADNGEFSGTLKDRYFPVNDYINPPFLPVPDRDVSVNLVDGTTSEGQITWDTVGAIARTKTPGVHVDVLLRTGKTVTAVWLGAEWSEVPEEKGEGGGLSEFTGVGNL